MSILRGLGFVVAIISSPSHAAEMSGTYRCGAKDTVTLQDNGVLGKEGVSEYRRKDYDGLLVDTFTGAITYPNGERHIWTIVRKGDSANDYVLISPELNLDPKISAADGATYFFRLRPWVSPV